MTKHFCVVNTKICYFDVTMNCTNSDAINAYVFVDIVLFTKENTTFSDTLLQDKCDSARLSLKEYHLRQWLCLSLA